ncbi:CUE domain-containing protein 2-A-like [Nematostella vectensis]|uniref:CUE domain-containing protein 2-A-like n=1 Tax=Nematostella vectensis TaxID=45351 RepID=UPI00207708E4|nr:CUE domain-containing protein 2-A-like [Nematostella vectensis]XP_048578348.1 CUE domain-containing protein 2-A-like [Nematostella vectensis]
MDHVVKKKLEGFLTDKLPELSLEDVLDDILLMYVTGVLGQLVEDESFDVDEFIEMMNAYVPGFQEIPREAVYCWMVDLAGNLTNDKTISPAQVQEQHLSTSQSHLPANDKLTPQGQEDSSSHHVTCDPRSSTRGSGKHSEATKPCDVSTKSVHSSMVSTEDKRDASQQCPQEIVMDKEFCDKIQTLCEIFPKACQEEINRCLLVAKGDVEEAAQLMILHEEEQKEAGLPQEVEPATVWVNSRTKPHQPSAKRRDINLKDNKDIKNSLVSKYGFVDVDKDQRTHKPTLHLKEDKKMTRYRDNQVVSTRGERYSLVKSSETEEEKRTYVSLKPARKYRFH